MYPNQQGSHNQLDQGKFALGDGTACISREQENEQKVMKGITAGRRLQIVVREQNNIVIWGCGVLGSRCVR